MLDSRIQFLSVALSHLDASEARSSIGSYLAIKVVLNHDDLLTSICISFQHSFDCSVGALTLAASDVPPVTKIDNYNKNDDFSKNYLRVANHELEVVVRVDASRNVLVIVFELLNRHDMIALVGFPDRHEVAEDLVGGLVARLEIRMVAHVVGHADVIDRHLATAVLIEYFVGLMDHVLTPFIEFTTDGT